MKIKKQLLICLCIAFVLLQFCSCGENKSYSAQMYSMDTVMDLTAYGKNSKAAIEKCESEIARINSAISVSETDSDIYRINKGAGSFVEVSQETVELISAAQTISERTDGAFDITSGILSELWGFRSKEYRVPTDSETAQAMSFVGYDKIEIEGNSVKIPKGAEIDLGAIGKGYASQRTHDIFRQCGIDSAMASLGGNVQLCGSKPDKSDWRVAIRHPEKADDYIAVVSVSDKAVVTSGGYQRFFEQDGVRYHHIFDARTGRPAESGIISATVICDDGMTADALSTALYVIGAEKAQQYHEQYGGFDMILVCDDGSVIVTEGIAGKAELCDDEYKMVTV